ncbi:MAG: hypothetical protein KatS3mg057_1870 [Herpetosiphonaceae bacterium]|nr:MAG: hypothetical protein KatS3mg057_1870 [Herpetosiphonaceae bacterium]
MAKRRRDQADAIERNVENMLLKPLAHRPEQSLARLSHTTTKNNQWRRQDMDHSSEGRQRYIPLTVPHTASARSSPIRAAS